MKRPRTVGVAICIFLTCFVAVPELIGQPHLYWVDNFHHDIRRANPDGSGLTILVSLGLTSLSDIAVDFSGGKMYWTDYSSNKVSRASLDGSSTEDVASTGPNGPRGIAMDVSAAKIYWTERGKIRRVNMDGTGVEDLVVTGLNSPYGIALDVTGGKMYWADCNTNKIQRANMDGGEIEDLVNVGSGAPRHIALDPYNDKMYWTDTYHCIRQADLDGKNVEDLGIGYEGHGISLDILGGKLYWSNHFGNPSICRADLNGSNVETLLRGGWPNGVAFVVPEPGPLEVAIDIKPGSDPNSVNLGAKGVVPVAIFGAEEFDVHDVDRFSLLLEGAGPKEKGKDDIHVAFEYINDDLFLDIIVQFSILELELEDGAIEAALTGSLLDGTEFMGTDAIRLVGGKAHAIPEPATLSLLVLGGLALMRRRRK